MKRHNSPKPLLSGMAAVLVLATAVALWTFGASAKADRLYPAFHLECLNYVDCQDA